MYVETMKNKRAKKKKVSCYVPPSVGHVAETINNCTAQNELNKTPTGSTIERHPRYFYRKASIIIEVAQFRYFFSE